MDVVIAFYLNNNSNLIDQLPNIIPNNISYKVLEKSAKLIDTNKAKEKIDIYFDYLVTDDLNIINDFTLEKDLDKVITNFNMQTSIENIFAISPLNNCKLDLTLQIEKIIDYIINGD